MLRPKALDHVGLIVTDMDRSLRFYTEALGLELLRRSGQGASSANSAVLKVGDQEINVFCRPDLIASGKELQRIDHFCLTMESATMDDLMRALSQTTIDIVSGPVERRDGTSVFVNDPDGVRVELLIKK
jgi:catechol 2,3-dioxygenase-like lactoylglutathione lyase family enzyme